MLNQLLFGFCFWDVPAMLLFAGITIWFIIQQRTHRKKVNELKS